jgi:hypothetical protein
MRQLGAAAVPQRGAVKRSHRNFSKPSETRRARNYRAGVGTSTDRRVVKEVSQRGDAAPASTGYLASGQAFELGGSLGREGG